MIGYCMLGTNDVARAKAFYDPIVTLLGASVFSSYSSDNRVFYTAGAGAPMFAIGMPYDGKPATVGNGRHRRPRRRDLRHPLVRLAPRWR